MVDIGNQHLWLLVTVATLDFDTLRNELRSPGANLPVLLAGLGVLGMAWPHAPCAERFDGVDNGTACAAVLTATREHVRASSPHGAVVLRTLPKRSHQARAGTARVGAAQRMVEAGIVCSVRNTIT
jgi:hypothetical protein